jgi:acyl-CoA thioesterase
VEENHPEEMSKSWTKCSACDKKIRAGRSFIKHCSKCRPNEVGCQVCHKMFSTKEVMLAHVSAAHPSNEKAYKCQFCTESFKSHIASLVHARLRHNDAIRQNWLQCPKCKKYFATKTAILNHKSTACTACEHCNKVLKSKIHLGNHMEENHPEEMAKSWKKCSACDKKFRAGRSFSKHWFKCRQNEVGCQVCLIMFSTKEVMLAHVSAAHPSNDQVGPDFEKAMCQFCDKVFINANNSLNTVQYYEHAWQKHQLAVKLSWKQCKECQVFLPDQAVLEEHMFDSHPSLESNIRRTECMFCKKVMRLVNYYKHARIHHPNEVQESWVKCSRCDDKFPNQDSVVRHSYRLHSQKTCQPCNKVFKNGGLYQKHLRSAHSTDSESWVKVKCQFCKRSFKSQKSFLVHARHEHCDAIQQNWIPCPDCQKCFPTQKGVLVHKNVCSVCEYCNKLLENRIQLGNHVENNHPEEMSKSWTKCSACDENFRAGLSFNIHLSKCQPREVECQVCKKMFSTKKSMLAHVSANHPSNIHQAATEIETVDAIANQLAVELCWKQCKVCQVFLSEQAVLEEHMLDSHPSKVPNIRQTECKFPTQDIVDQHSYQQHSTQKCQFCSEEFQTHSLYHKHFRSAHAIEVSGNTEILNNYSCHLCDKQFTSEDLMRWHLKLFHKQQYEEQTNSTTIENDNRLLEIMVNRLKDSKSLKRPIETNNIEYLLSPTSQNNIDLDAIDLTLKWL